MTRKDFLLRILESKRREVAAAQAAQPLAALKEKALIPRRKRPFFQTLETPGPNGVNIIAEIKRASPSAGPILPDLNPAQRAVAYAAGGARALSVLTDTPYFSGTPADLQAARAAVSLPVLRKDFLISPYQVYESAVMGADAVLLIVRILTDSQLNELLETCQAVDMDVLVEVNTAAELERASQCGASLIGINNRDLETFQTDTRRAVEIAERIYPGQTAVAASGIQSRGDIVACLKADIFNFLIGESLSRAEDPIGAVQHLLGRSRDHNGQSALKSGESHP